MRDRRGKAAHLDTRTALDYLEERLPAGRREAVEAHLAGPCAECRERLREVGSILARMRADRAPEVPPELHRRAVAAFAPRAAESRLGRLAARVARLVFDSAAQPLPAVVRRSVGESRRLRFALGADLLELECEPESPGVLTLRGRVRAVEPALWRVEVAVGAERFSAWPDARGDFALARVPPGRARITVTGPGARFRVPPVVL